MTPETPVERRLREMAEFNLRRQPIADLRASIDEEAAAIDIGREAIALVREWKDADFYGRHADDLHHRTAALLARCQDGA